MDAASVELTDVVIRHLRGRGPHVVGIGGAVAVGKTTVAGSLARELERRGRRAHIVATDAFLHPNAVLTERGIAFHKGFPESYDMEALIGFVRKVREGAGRIEFPVYSHAAYDVVPGAVDVVTDPDVVVVEGVVALQVPLAGALDVGIFVHAAEEHVRGWFVERFLRLTEEAGDEPGSFYARFAEMSRDEVRTLAVGTWDAINGPNLRDHILPTRARAAIVVEKAEDHSIRAISLCEPDQAADSDR